MGQVAAADDRLLAIRQDFPILARLINGRPLVYLDNAATTQKPRPVLDAMRHAYETTNANVHRGVHTLSQEATEAYEGARATIASFVNARSADEIVFVRGATEAINLVAATFGRHQMRAGDEIVVTELEHHSNIVPWQMLRDDHGVVLKVAPIDDAGDLLLDRFVDLLTDRTRLVCVTHVSNALGTITPIAEIVRLAHGRGARVLVDGCQAVAHQAVDVQAIDADFYVFSAHKMFGPTGIGALYGKREILDRLPPYQGGGEMIASVSFERTTFKPAPYRFEAGTPAINEAIGFAAAAGFIMDIGTARFEVRERALLAHILRRLGSASGIRIIGAPRRQAGIVSFMVEGVHPHDVATVLDGAGVAVRAGHHCAQPLMARLGLPATVRASLAIYNTEQDIDAMVDALAEVREIFG